MADKDPRKRCFHCVFTNCPGTNGALGIITPDLLAELFGTSERSSKKLKRHYHHHSQHKPNMDEKLRSDATKTEMDDIPTSIEEPKEDSEETADETEEIQLDNEEPENKEE